MTIADMIKKTRLDNNMTQSEYADKFGVTRQTVSSWENGKSLPDLQMIITICNTYNLSLDSLLNEDREYVNKIDMSQKFVRISKKILPILFIVVCVYLIALGVWKINAVKANEDYASRVTKLGFVLENGLYIMHDEETTYELPNQKLPFMKSEFYLQQISATYKNGTNVYNIILSYDDKQYTFSIDYGIDTNISGTISSNSIVEYDGMSEEASTILNKYKEDIENILHDMVSYYNVAYELS